MTPEHWRRLEELYDDVRDLPLAERKAVMDRADPEVRAQLEACLLYTSPSPRDRG